MPRRFLDDLPDLCLLAVFQNLPLLGLLLVIRQVNTRWSRLTSAELNRRRSLIIYNNPRFDPSKLKSDNRHQSRLIEHVRRDDALTPWARLPHIDCRNMVLRSNLSMNNGPSFHEQLTQMIASLMDSLPRITNLIVVQQFFDASALEQLVNMIDHWRGDLVTLKIYLTEEAGGLNRFMVTDDYDAKVKAQTVKLFDSINRATALKHLKLELSYFRNDEIPNLPPLTILSQLSTFYTGDLLKNQLNNTFLHNASGNGQLQITSDGYKLDVLLRIDREFCRKFVDVGIFDVFTIGRNDEDGDVGDDLDDLNQILRDMDRFCARFTSLTHLTVKIGNISLSMLSRSLSRLTQLVHLSLALLDELGTVDENPEDEIVPVPSVRLIALYLKIKSHNSTERLNLAEIFPNLQVLSITDVNRKCSVCKVPLNEENLIVEESDEHAPELRHCAQLARQPFRHCPNLHTIEVYANDSHFLSLGLKRKLITRDEL